MAKDTKITYNIAGLENLNTKMTGMRARVGILGSHAARTEAGSPINNATLGVIQMFGSLTKNIPPRDFLYMPVESHSKEIMKEIQKDIVRAAIAKGDYKKVYGLLGAAALQWVLEAFYTSGFGQWAPNTAATIARKKSDRPLIDTGQLRRAQTFDVVDAGKA